MTTMIRWDPFREMMTLRNTMDRLFDDSFRSLSDWSQGPQRNGAFALPLDVVEWDEEFVVQASVPGANPEDIDITLTNNVLTIAGEIKQAATGEGAQHHLQERAHGRFYRSLRLPAAVEDGDVDARYEQGVLTIHIPKSEEARPKRIPVRGSYQTIEGTTA
jgi:HSP20 family protein